MDDDIVSGDPVKDEIGMGRDDHTPHSAFCDALPGQGMTLEQVGHILYQALDGARPLRRSGGYGIEHGRRPKRLA
jgi:hypothetical protein